MADRSNYDDVMDSETPPVSPVFGLGECLDTSTITDFGSVLALSCKGPSRLTDTTFSPDGLFCRNQVVSVIKLKYPSQEVIPLKLVRLFGHLLDPYEPAQVKKFIQLCVKEILCLELLSEQSHTFLASDLVSFNSSDDSKSPWGLRMNVLQFLSVITRCQGNYQILWQSDKLRILFDKVKKCVLPVKQWSTPLRNYSGVKTENAESTSATFHFFHLQLELRWYIFIIFGGSEDIQRWILEDLIELAQFVFLTVGTNESYFDKQPFNCCCVKEIWTMLKILIENFQSDSLQKNSFWKLYSNVMTNKFENIYFRIWLTSNLACIGDYTQTGEHSPGKALAESGAYKNNGLEFAQKAVEEWKDKGGKPGDMIKLAINFFQYWGGTERIIAYFWEYWSKNIEKSVPLSNTASYNSVQAWFDFVEKIRDCVAIKLASTSAQEDDLACVRPSSKSVADSIPLGSSNDLFMEFVFMVAMFCSKAPSKDLNRLKSTLGIKLRSASGFNETGINRVATLFIVIASVVESNGDAIHMVERLLGVINVDNWKSAPNRYKQKFRAYAVLLIVLLRRSIPLPPTISSGFTKTVDELLSYSASSSSTLDPHEEHRQEFAKDYLALLNLLPSHTPPFTSSISLSREVLFSANLSMWISSSHKSSVVRICNALCSITSWLINSTNFLPPSQNPEGLAIYSQFADRIFSYLSSVAILNSPKSHGTDIEPSASLAADVTLLLKLFPRNSNEFKARFEKFALSQHTSPYVGEYFLLRLFEFDEFFVGSLTERMLVQVWLRHVAVNCSLPEKLTARILPNFKSTSYTDLITHFCLNYYVDKPDPVLLDPVISLAKVATTPIAGKAQKDNEQISSIVTSATLLLKHIPSKLTYVKGMNQNVMNRLLDELIRTPVGAMAQAPAPILAALETNLFDLFMVVVNALGTTSDDYLTRKLRDIVILSMIGFPQESQLIEYPPLTIYNYSENNQVEVVLKTILPKYVCTGVCVTDTKASGNFISTVSNLRKLGAGTLIIRLLPGILRCYMLASTGVFERSPQIAPCINSIVYCILVASGPSQGNQLRRQIVRESFDELFTSCTRLQSKQIFELVSRIAGSTNLQNGELNGRRFLRDVILPMLEESVIEAEKQRGKGYDQSLRNGLNAVKSRIH